MPLKGLRLRLRERGTGRNPGTQGCKRNLLEARAAVAEAVACYMAAKAAAEAADVQAKTLRLEEPRS